MGRRSTTPWIEACSSVFETRLGALAALGGRAEARPLQVLVIRRFATPEGVAPRLKVGGFHEKLGRCSRGCKKAPATIRGRYICWGLISRVVEVLGGVANDFSMAAWERAQIKTRS